MFLIHSLQNKRYYIQYEVLLLANSIQGTFLISVMDKRLCFFYSFYPGFVLNTLGQFDLNTLQRECVKCNNFSIQEFHEVVI